MGATSEADATRAVDAAARKAWEDHRREKLAEGGWYTPSTWDELDKAAQRNAKEQVLPIVWAVLQVIPSATEVREQVARDLEKHANAEAAQTNWGGTPAEQRGFVGGIREGARVARGEVVP
jgi:hypothetical protein